MCRNEFKQKATGWIFKLIMVVAILLGCIGAPLAHAKATNEGESGIGSEPLPLHVNVMFRDLEDAKQICSAAQLAAKHICSAALGTDTGDLSELARHPEHSIGEIIMSG